MLTPEQRQKAEAALAECEQSAAALRETLGKTTPGPRLPGEDEQGNFSFRPGLLKGMSPSEANETMRKLWERHGQGDK